MQRLGGRGVVLVRALEAAGVRISVRVTCSRSWLSRSRVTGDSFGVYVPRLEVVKQHAKSERHVEEPHSKARGEVGDELERSVDREQVGSRRRYGDLEKALVELLLDLQLLRHGRARAGSDSSGSLLMDFGQLRRLLDVLRGSAGGLSIGVPGQVQDSSGWL